MGFLSNVHAQEVLQVLKATNWSAKQKKVGPVDDLRGFRALSEGRVYGWLQTHAAQICSLMMRAELLCAIDRNNSESRARINV